MIFLYLLILLFFFAVAALALFFLFVIFLPTLGQQGTPVENPLTAFSIRTIPVPVNFRPANPDFLPLMHNSPKDCKVVEALHNQSNNRKALRGAFMSCVYTCPRTQIAFAALMNGADPQDLELLAAAPCEYNKENSDALPYPLVRLMNLTRDAYHNVSRKIREWGKK
ncbi:MAG: hypothetical protein LBS97_02205 [Treponema sp.]|jgi:hypothetical protein|nr:hypothetical protein [Treponema sp.]